MLLARHRDDNSHVSIIRREHLSIFYESGAGVTWLLLFFLVPVPADSDHEMGA